MENSPHVFHCPRRQRKQMRDVPRCRILFCERAMNRVAAKKLLKKKPAVCAAGSSV
jgi:hypothetical protein